MFRGKAVETFDILNVERMAHVFLVGDILTAYASTYLDIYNDEWFEEYLGILNGNCHVVHSNEVVADEDMLFGQARQIIVELKEECPGVKLCGRHGAPISVAIQQVQVVSARVRTRTGNVNG